MVVTSVCVGGLTGPRPHPPRTTHHAPRTRRGDRQLVNEAAKFRYRSGNQFNCGE